MALFEAVTGAALGIQAVGAGLSWWQSQEQARQMRRETIEGVRRLRRQQNETRGATMAAGAASGIDFESGSLQDYLRSMTQEFRREAEWMRSAGFRSASALGASANLRLGTDIIGAMYAYGSANKWWQSPGTLDV